MEMAIEEPAVARLGGEPVTMADLRYALYAQGNGDVAAAARQYALKKEILRRAKEQGIAVSAESVDLRMQKLRESSGYAETLVELEMDEAALRREIEIEETLEAWLECVSAVTDTEAEAAYKNSPQLQSTPERARFRHILITVNDSFPENTSEAAEKRIKALMNSIEPFADLAMRHSECPSALNGGEIGWVARNEIHPSLAKAVFEMEPMGKPAIVESEAGFHLAQLLELSPSRPVGREKGMAAAKKILASRKRRRALSIAMKKALDDLVMIQAEF